MGFILQTLSSLLWKAPFRYGLAGTLGSDYGLRSVLFHHIADAETPFTKGLNLRYPLDSFEKRIAFLARNYDPVGLDALLDGERPLPPRPLLVTFDDAYASIAREAAPVLAKHGVPGLFFVNAAFLDNNDISLDNLLCHVINTWGMRPVEEAARAVRADVLDRKLVELVDLESAILGFCPMLSLVDARQFKARLLDATGLQPRALAQEAQLYMTTDELARLGSFGIEVGNHTFSHVFCRNLGTDDLVAEVGRNQAVLEAIVGKPVRAFSVPYGSEQDHTPALAEYLRTSSHGTCFLVHALPNAEKLDRERVYRVSMKSHADSDSFLEIEVLPRLRRIKSRIRRPRATVR